MLEKKREDWIDYYKAFAIILVVLGHATYYFNVYIYQFHMAAFFFISGYCFSCRKKPLESILYKAYTLMLPYFTVFFFSALLIFVTDSVGLYERFWGKNIGVLTIIKFLFTGKGNYISWMGPSWFVPTLFWIVLLWICIFAILDRFFLKDDLKMILVGLISIIIYVNGFEIVQKGGGLFDLSMIGQVYFAIGILTKNIKTRYGENERKAFSIGECIGVFLVNLIILYFFSKVSDITVDYPSRHFAYLVLNVIASINGISMLWNFSKIVAYTNQKVHFKGCVLKKIGECSIAIMFFHFIGFKIVSIVLYALNIINSEQLLLIVPDREMGLRYWPMYVIVSIVASVAIWKLLTFGRIGKVLFGLDRTKVKEWMHNSFGDEKKDEKERKGLKDLLAKYKSTSGDKRMQFGLIILSALAFFPLIIKGIMLNDELLAELARKDGFLQMFKVAVDGEFKMGRPLRFLASCWSNFSFITENAYVNNVFQILIIVASVYTFGQFVYALLKDKRIAYLTCLIAISTTPIVFEHSAPQAFVGLVCIPIIVQSLSLTNWVNYLESNNKRYFIVSMLLWVISLLSYEYIVTYAPLYILIYWGKKNKQDKVIKDTIVKCWPPILVGMLYIVLTYLSRKLVASVYEGATVSELSLKSSLSIIKTLILSSVPGYFWMNNKYRYLTYMYSGEKYDWLLNINIYTIRSYITQIIVFLKEYLLDIRIIMIMVVSFCLLYQISQNNRKTEDKEKKVPVYMLLCIMIYLILPLLPNAIASLYQGNVTADFFTRLPISMNISYTISLLIAVVTIVVWNKFGFRLVRNVVIAGFVFIITFVQIMNGIMAKEMQNNYERFATIQQFMDTQCLKNLNNRYIYAENINETYNLLAAPYTYWNQYANQENLRITFGEEDSETKLYYINNEYFVVIGFDAIVIESKKKIFHPIAIPNGEKEYIILEPGKYIKDGDFYCYQYSKETQQAIEPTNYPFAAEALLAGATYDTIERGEGLYEDGWAAQNSSFYVYTSQGNVHIELYFPGYMPNDEQKQVTIKIGDEVYDTFDVASESMSIDLKTDADVVQLIKLESNFIMNSTGDDQRELSYIITNVYSE